MDHPGGKKILLKNAGIDASKQFDAFHARSVLDKFGPEFYIGEFGEAPAHASEASDPVSDEDLHEPFGELIPFGDPAWYQDTESPYYDDTHRRFRNRMRSFVDKEIMPFVFEWDENKQVPRQLFLKFAQHNLLAASLGFMPVKYMTEPGMDQVFGCVDVNKFNLFHEFIMVDEIARAGSGGVLVACSLVCLA